MAINLASKYSDQIAEVFTRSSFIKGKTAETFDLTGVKTLKVYTPITVEEGDYDRDGGLGRYGAVTEMQDGDVIRLWREDGRLRIEQIIDGETFNAFELLDESSTLWTLRHGTRAWIRTADSGMTALYLTLSFSAAYASLVVEENS